MNRLVPCEANRPRCVSSPPATRTWPRWSEQGASARICRINLVRLDLLPLRRRRQDIPPLIDQMMEPLNRLQHKSIRGVNTDAFSLLVAYDWPGNIRELENAIEHAFILCQGELIEMAHLPPELTGTSHPFRPASKGPRPVSDAQRAKTIVEAQTIQRALELHGYNRVAAFASWGCTRASFPQDQAPGSRVAGKRRALASLSRTRAPFLPSIVAYVRLMCPPRGIACLA